MRKIKDGMNLKAIAREITHNSELYGDEVDSVIGHLVELLAEANQFGIEITREIPDCWGGIAVITAIPNVRRHEWHF